MVNDTLSRHALVLALAFSLAPVHAQQPQPLNPPLKNWTAPLYWAPTPTEAEQQRLEQRFAQRGASALAQPASIFAPPGPMTFIAMTPCRVMDTRAGQGFTGAFGPPSLQVYGTRQVPVPSSTTCIIPSNAGAYSLNITAVPPGPLSFLSVWPAGQPYPGVSTLNDPISGGVIANAAIVPAGTSGAIQMVAGNTTDVIIDINGYYASPTDGLLNTGVGAGALAGNTTGLNNTAVGNRALAANTAGFENTAIGSQALQNNATGTFNIAIGGTAALGSPPGNSNSIYIGSVGTAGDNDGTIAIGTQSSNNIYIGRSVAIDSGTIAIGTQGTQTNTYLAGVYGTTLVDGILVCVDSSGRLGTYDSASTGDNCGSGPIRSSRRFKEQITDMGDSSSKLLQLRPVTFFYKPQYDNGSGLLQYGLIAEEVAKLYPEMVGYDKDGQPSSVKYQSLAPMLLNEVQKQHAQLQELEDRLAALEALLSGRTSTSAQPASGK